MRCLLILSILYFNRICCQLKYGYVYPIPWEGNGLDPEFKPCSNNSSRVDGHPTNCSLFQLCTSGSHQIYSCMNGFFFNSDASQCQYLPTLRDDQVQCEVIREQFKGPTIELVRSAPHRKSSLSTCTEFGIYADEHDCSLFHYCHENHHHEMLRCPNGFHFDPETSLCLPSQLVNCRYEPIPNSEDQLELNAICKNHPPGTYLPKPNRFDEFLICGEDGKGISMSCPIGLVYNALTTTCENGPCTFDSTLCRNEGQCVDDPRETKGFRCVCTREFRGEFCERHSLL